MCGVLLKVQRWETCVRHEIVQKRIHVHCRNLLVVDTVTAASRDIKRLSKLRGGRDEQCAVSAVVVERYSRHERGSGEGVVEGDCAFARDMRRASINCAEQQQIAAATQLTLSQAHCMGTITQLACVASNCSLLTTRAALPLKSPAEIGSV